MDRTRVLRLLLAVPLLMAGNALGVPGAAAAESCGSEIGGAPNYTDATIKSELVVPPGAFCYLLHTTVRGGITVGTGGDLFVENSEVQGSVSGAGVLGVSFNGGVIRGDVTIANALGASLNGVLEVRGSVTFTGSPGEIKVSDAAVRGSVTLNDNESVALASNTIRGNLTCTGNGFVVLNAPNTVGGNDELPAVVAPSRDQFGARGAQCPEDNGAICLGGRCCVASFETCDAGLACRLGQCDADMRP